MKSSLRFQLVILIAVRIVINTMVRMVYPYLGFFAAGLGVELRQLALALTLRSGAGVFGPFLASVADSRGRKTGMLFGVLLFTAGVGLVLVWPTYLPFTLALILTLVGNFVFMPSLQAYLGDRVPYRKRGRVLAVVEFGWSLAFILGVPLAGLLIGRFGWWAPFPFLAVLAAIGLGLLVWVLPSDPAPAHGQAGLWRNFRTVFAYRPAVAGLMMGALFAGANELISVVFGVWMEASFGVKIAALAFASAGIGLSELGGEALVSVLSDRRGKAWSVRAGLIANSLALLALPLLGVQLGGAMGGLFLIYLTFEFTIVSTIPIMTEILPPARATLMASFVASLSVGRALGALLAPVLYQPGGGILLVAVGGTVLNVAAFWMLQSVGKARLSETPSEQAPSAQAPSEKEPSEKTPL